MHHPKKAARDLRIDFFRGLCLLTIFSLHIRPNFLKKLTPHALGFSDAAEVFVFLSGFVCGIVYRRALVENGLVHCQLKALQRCAQIYVAHIFTLFMCLALMGLCLPWLSYESMSADLFLRDPVAAFGRAATLSYFPWLFNILPLYLALLLVLPLALWLARKVGMWATVLASFLVYGAVQVFPEVVRLPGVWGSAWFFNPFAWQFLFVLALALAAPAEEWRFRPRASRPLLIAALGTLVLAVVLKVLYAGWRQPSFYQDLYAIVFHGAQRSIPALQYRFPGTLKPNLQPLRLVHFFALVYALWVLLPRNSGFWKGKLARPFIVTGQNSLPVFCVSIVVVWAAIGVLQLRPYSLPWQLAANVAGWVVLLIAGCFFHFVKQHLSGKTNPRPDLSPAAAPVKWLPENTLAPLRPEAEVSAPAGANEDTILVEGLEVPDVARKLAPECGS